MLNFILGFLVGGVVVWLVMKRDSIASLQNDKKVVNPEQVEKRRENLEKVLEATRSRGRIVNDDVEKLLGVSDATAERYLQELESQGKLEQIGGSRGKQVFYRLK